MALSIRRRANLQRFQGENEKTGDGDAFSTKEKIGRIYKKISRKYPLFQNMVHRGIEPRSLRFLASSSFATQIPVNEAS